MIDTIGRTVLLVDDYDEALDFYVDTLDFEVLHDDEIGDGFRAVHVGPGDVEDAGLWLFEPMTDLQHERVGDQTGGLPCMVVYTDDCRGTYETLRERGVTFKSEPLADGEHLSADFEDPYGNVIILVELLADPT